MDAYLNRQDAMMRLDRTICLYDGEPVYVEFSRTNPAPDPAEVKINYFDDSGRRGRLVKYTSKNFTYYPIRLGYLNYNNNAYYLSRRPDRRQKQGLCASSILVEPRNLGGVNLNGVEMYNTIIGRYPLVSAALRSMASGITGVAISRDVAFRRLDRGIYSILFMETIMGTYECKTKETKFFDREDTSIFLRTVERNNIGEWLS